MNKKVILLSFLLCLFIAGAGWGGWAIFSTKFDQTSEKNEAISDEGPISEESEDMSTDIVNEPAANDVVLFTTGEYENGHDFISEFHGFYNDTLCWGRVRTADYEEQKRTALKIVEAFKKAKVQDEKLQGDFAMIERHAKQVIDTDDRDAMVTLHRLFHDLDIYFNGYSKDNTFGVTEFKGA